MAQCSQRWYCRGWTSTHHNVENKKLVETNHQDHCWARRLAASHSLAKHKSTIGFRRAFQMISLTLEHLGAGRRSSSRTEFRSKTCEDRLNQSFPILCTYTGMIGARALVRALVCAQPTEDTLFALHMLKIRGKRKGSVQKGFCKNLYFVEGAGPGAIRGHFVEWWPVGELTATKSQKPSQNFVEGIFDALTSYKRFLLTPFLHTPSI